MTPTEYYWEDLPVGTVTEVGSHTVSKDEILEFAARYDPQPFHIDEAAAADSIFGGLIASGWHTCAIMMRLVCDRVLLRAASLGSPGVERIRWLHPVRPGDTLRGQVEVTESRPSRSHPDRGIVTSIWEVRNQDDLLVMTSESTSLYRRRTEDAS